MEKPSCNIRQYQNTLCTCYYCTTSQVGQITHRFSKGDPQSKHTKNQKGEWNFAHKENELFTKQFVSQSSTFRNHSTKWIHQSPLAHKLKTKTTSSVNLNLCSSTNASKYVSHIQLWIMNMKQSKSETYIMNHLQAGQGITKHAL